MELTRSGAIESKHVRHAGVWRTDAGVRAAGASRRGVGHGAAVRRPLAVVSALAITGALVDLVPLLAHAIELPNKLGLAGPLWLAVQQQLYRSWGPVFAPFEVGAVLLAWVLVWMRRGTAELLPTLGGAAALTLMLALFFAVVQPVNAAFAGWTPATLPADWPAYRLRWELGHLARTALNALGTALLVYAARHESRTPGLD